MLLSIAPVQDRAESLLGVCDGPVIISTHEITVQHNTIPLSLSTLLARAGTDFG
jgi:hypothetical protein